jgi:aryl-alcohol dehydrogenase-like predicted oxidoreductase
VGKFTPETRFPQGDFRARWYENETENKVFLNDLAIVENLRPLAANHKMTLEQLALKFTLQHPAITTVIPGIKNVTQAEKNIRAGFLPRLEDALMTQIDTLVPPGGGRKIWPA